MMDKERRYLRHRSKTGALSEATSNDLGRFSYLKKVFKDPQENLNC